MLNSIKQLFRTPFRFVLFLLLSASGTALLIFGVNLWHETSAKLAAVEKGYTTIGTVQQKESSMSVESIWNSGSKTYTNFEEPVYDKIIPVSILKQKGLNYLSGPEKRPYYGALMSNYQLPKDKSNANMENYFFIAEFSPVKDCVPSEPVLVKTVKVLYGDAHGSTEFWFCDETNDHPKPLKAGKTYIAYLLVTENTHTKAQAGTEVQCQPYGYPISSQCGKDGKLIDSELNKDSNYLQNNCWEEVTKDFYTTGRGRYWLSYIQSMKMLKKTIPVLPTESLTLLPSFHDGQSSIVSGREISSKEYKNGEPVCLITEQFAQINGLKIGDNVTLPLIYADYSFAPSWAFAYSAGGFPFELINAQGEPYQTFWKAKYKIVGIYRFTGNQASFSNSSEIGRDEVIIPAKSVKASDENNIVAYGPMQSGTTSFQIPNGSIAKFEEALKKLPESSFLNIEYDDNGYEQVSGNLKSAQNAAILLSTIGLLSSLAIFVFLMYFFIVKQKKRTAVERSLGMSKRQCRVSLISGVMVLTLFGVTIGSIISSTVEKVLISLLRNNPVAYSLKYSNWTQAESNVKQVNEIALPALSTANIIVPLFLFVFVLIFSLLLVNHNLKFEPINLLSNKEEN